MSERDEERDLPTMRDELEALRRKLEHLEAGQRRGPRGVIAALAAGAALVTAGAIAQPAMSALHTFSPSTPARASEVNENFALVQAWMEQKLGPMNSANVAVPGTLSVTNATTLSGGVTGGLSVTSGDLDVIAGDLTVRDGTRIAGGFTDACTGDDATDVAGCVTDTNSSNAPYGRIDSDSFHTNGLGDGQMYIEGAYIDVRQEDLWIGSGMAGGTTPRDVHLGSTSTQVYTQGGLTTGGDVSAGGNLTTTGDITISGGDLTIGSTHIDTYIRDYIRNNCRISIGWRDDCETCGSGPTRYQTQGVNGGDCSGSGDQRWCTGNWAAIGFSGTMDANENIYVRFECG